MYQKLCSFKLLGFEEPIVKIFARYVTVVGPIHHNCFHVVSEYVSYEKDDMRKMSLVL